eukprot:Gregarina_sp_Pseudo_9__2642@NODE_289_length_3280_cov_4_072508_g256_i1_p1_GENE_NODE_289_length_3280_cov_4_072508_g256_i1NODE_289_length_3280_cov_4_072508_g256_i1_p1_ORF_typecomplete_len696_score137_72DUF900/PF05990_12/6_5e39Lipase/PF00151_19/0_0024Lipase_2/PF01674_18/0_034LCAT/PF02450_15/0_065_NODE_289_length_3280_cov_4_072508_g256_i111553242
MCIRVGYCKAGLGGKTEMKFGVSVVECSVSGLFYRGFPQVRMLDAPAVLDGDESNILKKTKRKLQHMITTTKHRWNRGISDSWEGERAVSLDDTVTRQTPNPAAIFMARRERPPQRSATLADVPPLGRDQDSDLIHSDPIIHFAEPRNISLEIRFRCEKYRRAMEWILAQLQPHTPAFGLHLSSEVIISVDRERGLDILGFVPVSQIYLEEKEGADISQTSIVSSVPQVPHVSQSLDMLFHKIPEAASPRKRQRLAPVAELAPTFPTPRRQAREATELRVSIQKQSAIEISRADEQFDHLEEELQRETEDLRVHVQAPELAVQGWISMGSIGISEVLVYVHGYNNTHAEATQTLGQMATFGNFPPHLKVVVFTWPAGSGFLSFFQARRNAEDAHLHESFRLFLSSLQEAGVRQFHVLCHSMGARLFLKSMRKITRETDILARFKSTAATTRDPLEKHQDLWAGKLHLLTATFMNPEYYLDEFIRHDYYLLRAVCSHITIYSDANDKALFWAETFSRKDALGRSVFGLQKAIPLLRHQSGSGGPSSASMSMEHSSSSDMGDEIFSGAPRLRFMHTVSFFQMDFSTEHLAMLEAPPTQLATRRHLRPWHRKDRILMQNAPDVEWLDLDIIDTTYMDTNVHGMRHSFWSLNREIIEDFRELLVTRKRASQRTGRLDRRDGNVWVFRVAPAFLTSIFDA